MDAPLNNIPLSLTNANSLMFIQPNETPERSKIALTRIDSTSPYLLLDIVTMSTCANNTQNTRVSKTNVTKQRNRTKLKTLTNELVRKTACIEEAVMGGKICTPVRILLPASAAAFAPRTSIHIVLGSKVEPWLTSILNRTHKLRRGSSVQQHQSCLTKTLSSSTAIWTLASITLPKAPDTELKDSIPLTQAFQLIHIEAYTIFIEMVSRHEIAFKLTSDSIESLIEYHRGIHCVDLANTYTHSELEIKKLQEEFVQAIHKFVYRTHVFALEGLEPNGTGELLHGRSGEVKNQILNLLLKVPPQKAPPPQKALPQKILPLLLKPHVPQEMVLGSSVEVFHLPRENASCTDEAILDFSPHSLFLTIFGL